MTTTLTVTVTPNTIDKLNDIAVGWTQRDMDDWTAADVAAVLVSQAASDLTRMHDARVVAS